MRYLLLFFILKDITSNYSFAANNNNRRLWGCEKGMPVCCLFRVCLVERL